MNYDKQAEEHFAEIENRLTWLNKETADYDDYAVRKFLFNKGFDYYFFFEFDNMYRDSASYSMLVNFLELIKSEKYIVSSTYEGHNREVLAGDLSKKDYDKVAFPANLEGWDILGQYFIQYDLSEEWCFIHSRWDSIVVVGANKSVVSHFVEAFGSVAMDHNEAREFAIMQMGGLVPNSDRNLSLFDRYKNISLEVKLPSVRPEPKTDYGIILEPPAKAPDQT